MKCIMIVCILCAIIILCGSFIKYVRIKKHLSSEVRSGHKGNNMIFNMYAVLMVFFVIAYVAFLFFLARHTHYQRIIYDLCALLFFGSIFVGMSVSVLNHSLDAVFGVKLNERDTMTGLMTKSSFERSLRKILDEGEGSHVLTVIDLDNFKTINDVHGHQKGDDIIRATADIIKSSVRSRDLVGRFGGDEFLILFLDLEESQVQFIMRRIEDAVISAQQELGCEICDGLSYGVAPLEGGSGKAYEEVFQEADKNLYAMKQAR